MKAIYTINIKKPVDGYVIRNIAAYKQGETESFDEVVIDDGHANAELVRKDYEAKGVSVSIPAQPQIEEVEERPKRKGRKPAVDVEVE